VAGDVVQRWCGGPILNSDYAVEIALGHSRTGIGSADLQAAWGAARKRIRLADVGGETTEQLASRASRLKVIFAALASSRSTTIWSFFAVRRAKSWKLSGKLQANDFDICIDAHGKLTTVMAIDFRLARGFGPSSRKPLS
jgi:hypothetical protein